MSQALINEYLAELDRIRRVGGTHRETSVREAFKDLLKRWGRAEDLVFVAEHRIKTATRTDIVLDGALLHIIRTPLGTGKPRTSATTSTPKSTRSCARATRATTSSSATT